MPPVISRRHFAGYLPARTVKRYLDAGTLHPVAGAPSFPYPTWLVWRNDISSGLLAHIDAALAAIVSGVDAETDAVFYVLTSLNDGEIPATLGDIE